MHLSGELFHFPIKQERGDNLQLQLNYMHAALNSSHVTTSQLQIHIAFGGKLIKLDQENQTRKANLRREFPWIRCIRCIACILTE